MKSKKKVISVFLVLTLLVSLAAMSSCQSKPTDQSPGEQTPTENANDGPFTKYDPPIEVTFIRPVIELTESELANAGQTLEDNDLTRMYLDELGIKIKYLWTSPSTVYEEKLSIALSSGDLPDFVPIQGYTQLAKLIQNEILFMDMKSIYEKYSSPHLFESNSKSPDGSAPFDAATINGRLVGVPVVNSSIGSTNCIFIRKDWMRNLGITDPQNIDDVLAIAEAFTKKDPDQNGNDDTLGFLLSKTLTQLRGIANCYHAYPGAWIEDESGKLVYGSIQPEMREVLLVLQDLYKKGIIDQEFGVKDNDKANQDVVSGRIGLLIDSLWSPVNVIQNSKDLNQDAEWESYPLLSADDRPVLSQVPMGTSEWFAVNKDSKHPEALIKLMNVFLDKGWGPEAVYDKYVVSPEKGLVFFWSPLAAAPPLKELRMWERMWEAFDAGKKAEDMDIEAKTVASNIEAYTKNGDNKFYGWHLVYGKNGSFKKAAADPVANNTMLIDKFTSAPTPTMTEKKATLDQLESEVFTKIISGEPIENFDKFVEDWKTIGGAQITEEVNGWYSRQ
jgi:putative aldouronate transport system substrate-binding protein